MTAAVVALVVMATSAAARAAPVRIDPGAYAGPYDAPALGQVTGPSSTDLGAGTHTIALPGIGTLSFDVDALGNVTSLAPDSATGGAGALTLRNASIRIDPGIYQGPYELTYGPPDPPRAGAATVVLVPGAALSWSLALPGIGHVPFRVDGAGSVTASSDSAMGNGSTLLLANTTVQIDPGAYAGPYGLTYGPPTPAAPGPQSFVLIPGGGLAWSLVLPFLGHIPFTLDGAGNVTSGTPDAATGSGTTLAFANTTVHIDPGAYAGPYDFTYGPPDPAAPGRRSFVVIRGGGFGWSLNLPFLGHIPFTVDGAGNVTSGTPDAATGMGPTLAFVNTTVHVDPGAYVGPYGFTYGPPDPAVPGPRSFVIIPGGGLGWSLVLPFVGHIPFTVDGAGNVTSGASDSAQGSGAVLSFLNVDVTASAGSASGTVLLGEASGQGTVTTALVPGANLAQYVGLAGVGAAHFTVYDSCAFNQGQFTFGAVTVALGCEKPAPPGDTTPPVVTVAALPSITNQAEVTVTGTVTDDVAVGSAMFFVNGVPAGGPLSIGAGGAVSATVPLPQGSDTIVLRATDTAGNVASAAAQIVSDTTAPALTIVTPTPGQAFGAASLTITVTVADATAATVGVMGQSFAVPSGTGSVTTTITLPAEGSNTVTVTATDAAGNSSAASVTVLLDETAPVISTSVASGSAFGAQPGDQLPLGVAVAALSTSTVTLSTGGTFALLDGGGLVQTSVPLVQGSNTFTITAVDQVGLPSSLTETVVYDTTPPAGAFIAPTPGAFARGTVEVTVSATDALTGVASVGIQVDGGAVVAAAPGEGASWALPINTAALADGLHQLTATLGDGVGNASTVSGSFVVDNTPPSVTIGSPAVASYVRGTITITASAADATSGVASLSITAAGTTLATCPAASCSVTLDTTRLPDGPFTVTAAATDGAANAATPVQITAIADNQVPTGFLVSPANGAIVTSSLDVAVNVTTPYFAGVTCAVGSTWLGSSSSPTFSQIVSLATTIDGPLLVACVARDDAGGAGAASSTVVVKNWTEHFSPASLNLGQRSGRVTLAVRGPRAALLLPIAGSLTLAIPGASAVPAYAVRAHAQDDDDDCDDRTPAHVDVKFLRGAVDDAVAAGLATGALALRKPFTVTLQSGTHPIGGDAIVAVKSDRDR